MSDFWKGLLWTAIPIVVLSVINAAVKIITPIGQEAIWVAVSISIVRLVAVACIIVASVAFWVQGKKQMTAGILAGAGIGIVAWGASDLAIFFRLLF